MSSLAVPEFVHNTNNLRAVVTTRWGKSGYRPVVIKNIEEYYLDTSLDNDADSWVVTLGDPQGDFLAMLQRDAEVRVELYGIGANSNRILTGIADEIGFGSSGILRLQGRDYSSLAIDSIVPPGQFRNIHAWKLVDQQAREIGFQKTQLAKTGPAGKVIRKAQFTDGSESYWEFWYRIYRKEKMWLWTEPTGLLVASNLNYTGRPIYYFGYPPQNVDRRLRALYIPVEQMEIRKNTQQRVGEVWVYGQKGDNGFLVKQTDPTTRSWIKRPKKILYDPNVHTQKAAIRTAWEEIFEGKVGSVEVTLTIAHPGFEIRQNSICQLNLPDPGIGGEFFVVGVRSQAGPDGYVQEIRLRQKQYAITRRVPQEIKPRFRKAPTEPDVTESVEGAVDEATRGLANIPRSWGTYFVKAATKWHGVWDFNLFLATLIGIADQETGGRFVNVRGLGGPGNADWLEWYAWRPSAGGSGDSDPRRGMMHQLRDQHGRTRAEWERAFANEPGGYTPNTYAVGPMQLHTLAYKHWADDLYRPDNRDEFSGGRWHPEHNIMAGARVLRDKLKTATGDSGRDIDMWAGVSLYGHNAHLYSPGKPTPYAISVKNKVHNDPAYLGIITDAIAEGRDTIENRPAFDPGDSNTKPGQVNGPGQLAKLVWVARAGSRVDVEHVDWDLLRRVDSLGRALQRVIVITSGFRYTGKQGDGPGAAPNGGDTQWYLWQRYQRSGFQQQYIAARPGLSNHEKGQAVDCAVGGVAMGRVVPPSMLAIYGLHYSVPGDMPHVTKIGVNG